jgi:hypothetical protein
VERLDSEGVRGIDYQRGRKMTKVSAAAVLNGIADTLVVEAKFTSKEDALRSLARSAVRERMVRYRRRIQRLERKHGADFAEFTRRIKGSATPQQEDDWLAWRSAIEMLNEWKAVYQNLDA